MHLLSAVNILGSDTVLSSLDAILSAHVNVTEMGDSLLPGPGLEPDGRDVDKAGSSSWLETSHLIHGRELGVVKTFVGISSFDNDVTLVELQSDETVDSLLRSGDSGSDELPLW